MSIESWFVLAAAAAGLFTITQTVRLVRNPCCGGAMSGAMPAAMLGAFTTLGCLLTSTLVGAL